LPSGARCEKKNPKDLTTPRPRCIVEHECCGAAVLNKAKRAQIEVCHSKTMKTYPYYSKQGAEAINLPFTCFPEETSVLAAKELAASIAAIGAAVYMLI